MFVARQGHALHDVDDGRRCWTAPRACGASMPATAGRRSPRRSARQVAELDYAPAFQMGHPKAFELRRTPRQHLRRRASTMCSSPTPARNRSTPRSRSRSPITAPGARARAARLIGRERGYHGVNFGGISVGGIVANRKTFGTLLAGVDHLPPHARSRRATPSRRGEPRARRGARRRSGAPRRPCTTPRPSPPSSSSRSPARPACSSRRRAILKRLRAICDQARHPADLRRGDHRLRPPRRAVRRRIFRRHARHHHHAPRASPTAPCRWAPCSSQGTSTTRS